MKISVLRLGHRFIRDKRTTTHVALVSRALNADQLILDTEDRGLRESLEKIVNNWGGTFKIKIEKNWKKFIENFKGDKIHLTMYGMPVEEKIEEIKKSERDKLIIVGGKKVPAEVYHLVDYNIAIGNQPHSEIAALAIFLDRLFEGKELEKDFSGGKKKIVPQERGKHLVEKE